MITIAALFGLLGAFGATPAHAAAWTPWGGTAASAPDAAALLAQRGDQIVVVIGTDHALWYRLGSSGSPRPGGWHSLGGYLTSDPGVTYTSQGAQAYLFARGGDNALWYRVFHFADNTFGPWTSLGGTLTCGPDAVTTRGDTVEVFACGTDHAIWSRTLTKGWSSVGGKVIADPGAAYRNAAPNTLYLFGRGADGALWMRTRVDSAWGTWTSLGGNLTSGPDATYNGSFVVVGALGTDGAVWYRLLYQDGVLPWASLGGRGTSDPSLMAFPADGGGPVEVFVRGTENGVWRTAL
jgi:hypothetical protein